MSRISIAAAMLGALGMGDFKSFREIFEDDKHGPGSHSRPPKGLRCKDISPERHKANQARHMTSEKSQTGMTGNELRKSRKKRLKARMQSQRRLPQ